MESDTVHVLNDLDDMVARVMPPRVIEEVVPEVEEGEEIEGEEGEAAAGEAGEGSEAGGESPPSEDEG